MTTTEQLALVALPRIDNDNKISPVRGLTVNFSYCAYLSSKYPGVASAVNKISRRVNKIPVVVNQQCRKEIDVENGRNSNFEGLVTLTFDPAVPHTVVHQ